MKCDFVFGIFKIMKSRKPGNILTIFYGDGFDIHLHKNNNKYHLTER